jgi:hypothetical protein
VKRAAHAAAYRLQDSTEFLTRLDMDDMRAEPWVVAHVAPMTDEETVRLERARASFEKHNRHELVIRAKKTPGFSPRALVFADSSDGVGYFFDVALDDITRAVA